MTAAISLRKQQLSLVLKGFAMGLADIVPGVSGGTIAFITGIYQQLVECISLVDKKFVNLLLQLKIKAALSHIHFQFLFPLLCGILSAIILMSRFMHFLLSEYAIPTWALFFGLITASILFIAKQIHQLSLPKNLLFILIGTISAVILVSLIPVETSHDYPHIFVAGAIAICAMILPGISGSFILLILGKYAFVTGALKNPLAEDNFLIIVTFSLGCLVGILSFSKVLNWMLKHYHNTMMCFLTGFMIGSLKKIWPWKEIIKTKVIRGKTYILQESNILPDTIDFNFGIALFLFCVGFSIVIFIERLSTKKI